MIDNGGNLRPGILVFVHGTAPADRAIQFGEWVHGDGGILGLKMGELPSHVAITTGRARQIVEARMPKVRYGKLDEYAPGSYTLVPIELPDPAAAVRFGDEQVGMTYGFADLASLGLNCLLRVRLRLGVARAYVCSELAALMLLAGGADIGKTVDPEHVTPSGLLIAATVPCRIH